MLVMLHRTKTVLGITLQVRRKPIGNSQLLWLRHPWLRLKQQLLRSKGGNGNFLYRYSDVELPASYPGAERYLSMEEV